MTPVDTKCLTLLASAATAPLTSFGTPGSLFPQQFDCTTPAPDNPIDGFKKICKIWHRRYLCFILP
jgi:hypothetical protein